MTTLLTGATGFLGGHLVRRLLDRGDRVRILARPTSDLGGMPDDVEVVRGDVTDRRSVADAVDGCDRVFHAAAMVRTWVRDRSVFARVNVDGTRNVIEAALSSGARRIVYTSTFLILKAKIGGLITECDRAGADDVWTDYARTKREAQLVVDDFVAKGAPVVTVYPGVIFGPGKRTEGNIVVNKIIDFMKGKFVGFLGKGRKRWSYAFVDDVARGHLLADEKGVPGEGYILGGENVPQRDFMALVAELSGREPPTRCVPFWLAKAVGALQELRATLTGRSPEVTRAVVRTFRHDWALDLTHSREQLGYVPAPLRENVERTLRWIHEEGLAD